MPRVYGPRNFTRPVSFKLTEEQGLVADALRATFPDNSFASVGRWIFSEPAVLEIITERIRSGEVTEPGSS